MVVFCGCEKCDWAGQCYGLVQVSDGLGHGLADHNFVVPPTDLTTAVW